MNWGEGGGKEGEREGGREGGRGEGGREGGKEGIRTEGEHGAVARVPLEKEPLMLRLGPAVGVELFLDTIDLEGGMRRGNEIQGEREGRKGGGKEGRTDVCRSRRMSGMDMPRLECVTPTITTPLGSKSYRTASPATR